MSQLDRREHVGRPVRGTAFLRFITVSLALLLALPVSAGLDPSIYRHATTLDNGLYTILAKEFELPLVTFRLGLPVGRLHDPPGKEGMAQLLARTLTDQRAGQVEALGGESGAYVTNDYTVFWVRGMAEDYERLLSLLVQTVVQPQVSKTGLARARDRLRGELKLDQSLSGPVARRRLMAELYGEDHPLGRNSNWRSLGRTGRREAQERLSRFYGAGGAVLAVVGNIETDRFFAAVGAAAGEWPPGELLPSGPAPEVALDKPRVVRVRMKGLTQSSIILGWPGIARTDPDWERFQVFNHVLGGGGFASRLMQAVRVEEGRTYGINSSANAGLTPGPITIATATASAGTDATVALILRQLKQLLEDGVAERELAEAREYLIGSYNLAVATPDGLASRMVAKRMLGLDDPLVSDHVELLESVDAAAALEAGRRFLDAGNYALVVVESPD